ncbi:MAG TPA: hypothetical protein VFX03_14320, partial [Thermomicrobiales bacterium]|nr:hypothetical protein [Thermomicrobiales bacterium]
MAPAAARVGLDRIVRSLCFLALLATLALAMPGAGAQNASQVPAPTLPTDPAQPCPAPASLQDAPPPGPDAPVYDYAIVIDVSGSMNGDFNLDGTPDPLAASGQP